MFTKKKTFTVNERHETVVANTDVFQVHVDMRTDVPNVVYIELVEFLMQGLELKLDLAHIVLLVEFGTRVGKIFNKNLTQQHKIF